MRSYRKDLIEMGYKLTPLITNAEIRKRITELAAAINEDYRDIQEDNPLLVLCTLRGAVFFAADLVRELRIPAEINFLKIRSYVGTRPAGAPVFDLGEKIDVSGRHILIVEDIVDTGRTMDAVLKNFSEKGAEGIRIASLLDKPDRRVPELVGIIQPDYTGFTIDDLFVVGWGLDYNECFRLLPDIMVYHPEKENQ